MAVKKKSTETPEPAKKSPKKTTAVRAKKPAKTAGRTKAYKTDKYTSELSRNSKYFNRELSWLEFDDRILHEARDTKNPLLERLNFLSITASNMDEFYIVRVASLRDMQSVGMEAADIAGFTTTEQLERIDAKTRRTMALMYSTFGRSLVPAVRIAILPRYPPDGVDVARGARNVRATSL